MTVNDTEYLAHYGVKGMKWGVRRYEKYDGSYTQRGVKRFRESEANYDSAKAKLRSAKQSGNPQQIKSAKGDVKVAKRKMNKSYKRLKSDKLADQGKALYKSGKTIGGNMQRAVITQGAIVVGGNVASALLANTGRLSAASVVGRGIAYGGTAINAAVALKNSYDNKRLRAYYAH